MNTEKRDRFSLRRFVSVLTAFSFVGAVVTGVFEFVKPQGRVAHWTGWHLFGLDKDQWEALHIWLCLILLVGSGFHIYFNWRPLVSYFKSRVVKRFAFRGEWVLALIVCFGICAATLAELPPFSSFLEFHETVKHSWERVEERAPIPHAEALTLEELAGMTECTLEELQENLRAQGIVPESEEATLGQLAEARGMTPHQLYLIAAGERHAGGGCSKEGEEGSSHGPGKGMGKGKGGIPNAGGMGRGGGGGWGRRTLADLCAEEGLTIESALKGLGECGIEAAGSMTLREIAEKGGVTPHEIRYVVTGKE